MNLNALKYVIAIEEYGSLSEAAQNLYVSQPYLSKIIKGIEDEYHFTIFQRTTTGVIPTLQGRYFLDMGRNILNEVDHFDHMFHEVTPMMSLNVASFPSSYSLSAYIRFLNESDPMLYMHSRYREENVNDVIDDIYSHKADIGIIFMKESHAQINQDFFRRRRIYCEKLFRTTPHLLVRQGHPILQSDCHSIEELYQYNLVAFEASTPNRNHAMDDGFYNQASISSIIDYSRFKKAIYVQHRGTMHSLLQQTDSIAIGNHITTAQLPAFGLVYVPISQWEGMKDPERYSNTMYFLHLKDTPLSSYAKRYIDLLREYGNQEI